jgi:DNA-directed RNA polymerase specialized sigma24 family protein
MLSFSRARKRCQFGFFGGKQMRKKPLDDKVVTEARALIRNGSNLSFVAEQLYVDRDELAAALEQSIRGTKKRKAVETSDEREILRRKLEGQDTKDIAEALNLTISAVNAFLKQQRKSGEAANGKTKRCPGCGVKLTSSWPSECCHECG